MHCVGDEKLIFTQDLDFLTFSYKRGTVKALLCVHARNGNSNLPHTHGSPRVSVVLLFTGDSFCVEHQSQVLFSVILTDDARRKSSKTECTSHNISEAPRRSPSVLC